MTICSSCSMDGRYYRSIGIHLIAVVSSAMHFDEIIRNIVDLMVFRAIYAVTSYFVVTTLHFCVLVSSNQRCFNLHDISYIL